MKRPIVSLCFLLVFILNSHLQAVEFLNNGLINAIESYQNDTLYVQDSPTSPPNPTTLNIIEDAFFPDQHSLYVQDTSIINVSGGDVDSGIFWGYDNSTINITGGDIKSVHTSDNATLNVSSGIFLGLISSRGSSILNMSGGSVSGLSPMDFGVIELTGGDVRNSIVLSDNSTLRITGSNFNINGTQVEYGEYSNIIASTFSGRLLDGTIIDVEELRTTSPGASLVLVAPEPASLSLLVLGGLSMLRRKRNLI